MFDLWTQSAVDTQSTKRSHGTICKIDRSLSLDLEASLIVICTVNLYHNERQRSSALCVASLPFFKQKKPNNTLNNFKRFRTKLIRIIYAAHRKLVKQVPCCLLLLFINRSAINPDPVLVSETTSSHSQSLSRYIIMNPETLGQNVNSSLRQV